MSENHRPPENVRAESYFAARAQARCWHCQRATSVLAVALPPNHLTLEEKVPDDASGDADEDAAGVWQPVDGHAFLFHIESLSDEVSRRLTGLWAPFRPMHGEATMRTHWANHCQHCETLLDDHELHCEPDGAFVPTSESAAALIELHEIAEPFIASAGGYTLEPEFFGFMRRRGR